jgi:HSP20 family molecular chaperone IbpA
MKLETTNNHDNVNSSDTKRKSSGTKHCNKFKCIALTTSSAVLLIGVTFFFTKTFYEEKAATEIAYQNHIDQFNKVVFQELKQLKKEASLLKHALSNQRKESPHFFDFSDMFSNSYNAQQMSSITKQKDSYHITIEIPGFKKDQINVELNGNSLVITADNKDETNSKKFKHILKLENDISADKIESSLENGILTINIPRTEAKTRAITID